MQGRLRSRPSGNGARPRRRDRRRPVPAPPSCAGAGLSSSNSVSSRRLHIPLLSYYQLELLGDTGRVATNSLGLFVQDAWSIGRRLTVNAGLRTERETVPSYRAENTGIHFGFGDRLSPRLGLASPA
jgi:outer membrane receptor protein involved in Fe transport